MLGIFTSTNFGNTVMDLPRKLYLSLMVSSLCIIPLQAQDYILFSDAEPEPVQEMVLVYGQLLDANSNQPIQGHINFEKMPRANNVGYISNQSNGDYKLHMLQNRKYTLEVTADGYVTIFDVFDIDDIDKDGQIKKDFLLTKSDDGNILRMNNLLFELGRPQILESSYDELNSLAQMLHNNLDMKIQLEGHTDFKGNPERNMQLSEDRVVAVREYLMAQGIKKKRIKLKAFGGTKPLSTDKTEEASRKNRRVEVRILSQ